ncbi:Pc13g06040 [Talaromyces islandicus]|uniref:Pc13g06040 n=1 Tax=Talaromyces islandicus TaxID=28573 RepID=A0A0U1M9F6_TALIS|nr:Pc13g06040 [Talaromyces islandicus]
MPEARPPLTEAHPDSGLPTPQKPSKMKANVSLGSPGPSETNTANGETNEEAIILPKFTRVRKRVRKRAMEEDDDEEDDDESDGEQNNGAIHSVPENESSDCVWIISEEGIAIHDHLEKQAANCDQDEHGLYIYNDFTAYGVNEVVDNWLKDFNKEVSRRNVAPYAVWAQLEGLSLFLQLDYVDIWFQGDDSRGFAETISMVGKALLTGLAVLKRHQLSNPNLPENCGLQNISLILALFVEFANSWDSIGDDQDEEIAWVPKLAELAKHNNVEIKGPYNFQERNEHLFEPMDKIKKIRLSDGDFGVSTIVNADEVDDDIKYSDDYSVKGWKVEFKAYTKRHAAGGRKTIGGTHYDLTKMSKAEKREIRFGGGGWF